MRITVYFQFLDYEVSKIKWNTIVPPKNASLRHVALAVNKLDECEQFYNLLGMSTELKTDDYAYLTGNGDNISLHSGSSGVKLQLFLLMAHRLGLALMGMEVSVFLHIFVE